MRRFTTVSVALTIAATAAFAGAAVVVAQDDSLKIGVVTDVGQLEDKSFNEFTWLGAMDAAEALGADEFDVIITEEISDYDNNINTFIDQGYDIIVTAGSLLGTATQKAATENPDVTFVGIDQNTAEGLGNFQGVLFQEEQPGYLAGVVAARLSGSGIIGAVGGTNLPAVVRFRDGFYRGATATNPDIEVLYQEANPDPVIGFNTPDLGSEIAEQMIDLGADVIFQIAGGTGVGVIEAACQNGALGIGVDTDQSLSMPPQAAECIVTSAEKSLREYTNSVIRSVSDGTFVGGNVVYDAASEPPGIRLSPFQDTYADLLTPELEAELAAATAGFIDGSIDPTTGDVPFE